MVGEEGRRVQQVDRRGRVVAEVLEGGPVGRQRPSAKRGRERVRLSGLDLRGEGHCRPSVPQGLLRGALVPTLIVVVLVLGLRKIAVGPQAEEGAPAHAPPSQVPRPRDVVAKLRSRPRRASRALPRSSTAERRCLWSGGLIPPLPSRGEKSEGACACAICSLSRSASRSKSSGAAPSLPCPASVWRSAVDPISNTPQRRASGDLGCGARDLLLLLLPCALSPFLFFDTSVFF